MIESQEFQQRASVLRQKLLAALLVRDHLIAYDGTLDGMDVILIGYAIDPANPTAEVVPIAVEISDELFRRIEVSAVRVFNGEELDS